MWNLAWSKPHGTKPWNGTWSNIKRGSCLSTSSWCHCTRSRLGLPTSLRSPSSSHWRCGACWEGLVDMSYIMWGTSTAGEATASLWTACYISNISAMSVFSETEDRGSAVTLWELSHWKSSWFTSSAAHGCDFYVAVASLPPFSVKKTDNWEKTCS